MIKLYKNIQTDFLGQIFLELFQFKTRSLFLGHPVDINQIWEENLPVWELLT